MSGPSLLQSHHLRCRPGRFGLNRRSRRSVPLRRLVALCLTIVATAAPTTAEPEASARFLVFVLDAVPYRAVVDLTRPADGSPPLLDSLEGPVPLISTFPSNTGVALTAILHRFGLESPPGYEVKFFDHTAGKIRGGGLISYSRIHFDWHHFFDWQLRGFFSKSWAYARPLAYSVKEVRKAIEAFEATDKRAFFVYVNSTDAIGHIKGPEGFRTAFENLDAEIAALRARSPVPVYTVILSDHGLGGGVLLQNARKGVVQRLEQDGWRTPRRIGGPGDVVLTPFGLVSSFEAYTSPGDESAVAETLVTAPGVDLCTYRENGGWIAVNAEGRASIRRRERDRTEWSYSTGRGDPLRLAEPLIRLRSRQPAETWFGEEDWFEETWDQPYPDPLFRIAGGFERVRNAASVMCSVSNGYLYGSMSAWVGSRWSVGRVRWTHGALLREEATGFLMTDYPGWERPTAVRFDHALDFLTDHLLPDPAER